MIQGVEKEGEARGELGLMTALICGVFIEAERRHQLVSIPYD